MIAVSLVIPAHNEQGSIVALVRERLAVMLAEVIGVNDASRNGTAAELPRLRLIRHACNAGQRSRGAQAATQAVVVTIDGDGQNPPAGIPPLMAANLGCSMGFSRPWHRTTRLARASPGSG
jgi:dolichol-phosphate mannosyltransferase